MPSLLSTFPFLVQRDYFHDVEVAGDHSEHLLPRAQGETVRTCPISHQPSPGGGCRGAPGLPHRRRDAGAGPWTTLTLPRVGCSQQPPVPSVPAGALPAAPDLPGHHLPAGRAAAK